MKLYWMKAVSLLLVLTLTAGMLTACGKDDTEETQTTTAPTEPATESTEPTGGIIGENETRLNVEYETPGVIAAEAPGLNSKQVVLNGVTYDMPCLISALLANGWSFSTEELAQMTVSAKTETRIMGFEMSLEDIPWLNITSVSNGADTEKTVGECYARRLILDLDQETETALDFVLPGGITAGSTAADVLAVYGDVLENESFDYVQVGKKMLYYTGHLETGLNYYFGFNDDGTLNGVTISF